MLVMINDRKELVKYAALTLIDDLKRTRVIEDAGSDEEFDDLIQELLYQVYNYLYDIADGVEEITERAVKKVKQVKGLA